DLTPMLRPERDELVALLDDLTDEQWGLTTECPAWTVQGVATHLLGDDLSLLSRQRDGHANGLALLAVDHPELGFRDLLDTFNDRWAHTARFLSPALVVDLLRVT